MPSRPIKLPLQLVLQDYCASMAPLWNCHEASVIESPGI
jgi:hypothetical protein